MGMAGQPTIAPFDPTQMGMAGQPYPSGLNMPIAQDYASLVANKLQQY